MVNPNAKITSLNDFLIGFDKLFHETNVKYPPYNIRLDQDRIYLELALAGFKKEDLTVEHLDKKIIIEGSTEERSDLTYYHRGISTKKFSRSFVLADNLTIEDVTFVNGLLTVIFRKNEVTNERKLLEIK